MKQGMNTLMRPMIFTMNYWKRSRLMLTKIKQSPPHKIANISSITWGKCFFYASLIPFLLTSSCKNPDNIGLDVIPASDYLNSRSEEHTLNSSHYLNSY